jgi:hypothetical protein
LVVELIFFGGDAQGITEFILGKAVHSNQKAALVAGLAGPLVYEVVDRFPSPQVEVADAEIRAIRDMKRFPQGRQEVHVNVVKDAGHCEGVLICEVEQIRGTGADLL